MMPLTHALVGTGIGMVFAPSPVCLAACVAGSLVPDWFDSWAVKIKSKGKYLPKPEWDALYNKQHRTWSHNTFYWLILLLFFIFFEPVKDIIPPEALDVIRWFLGGILIHIGCDFLTPMGIGFLPFLSTLRISSADFSKRRYKKGFHIKTKSLGDTLFGYAVFGLCMSYCIYIHRFPFLGSSW